MDDNVNNVDEDSANILRELRATFRDEANELLADLESALLELEENPQDGEQVGRAFRAMHTIKGSGGAVKFHDIVELTHELESVFDKVRTGKMTASKEIITLALSACDQIKAMLGRYYQGASVDAARTAEILAAIRKIMATIRKRENTAADADTGRPVKVSPSSQATYRIRFRPSRESLSQGITPLSLLHELRALGHCEMAAFAEAIPPSKDGDAQASSPCWDAVLSTSRGIQAIRDISLFARDSANVKIDVIDEEGLPDDEEAYKKIGEILLERGDLDPKELNEALISKKRVGDVLVETGVLSNATLESALLEQRRVREIRERRHSADAPSSIRVATDKLDNLVNLVGELVTVQARLNQMASVIGHPDLFPVAEEVERLTESLRDNTMSIRMVPIGTMFGKLTRLVRDLSSELGKEIQLATDGAGTELDKTMIERLSDPLVHIIRNSIDHGIERPETRIAAGKPRQGTIRLSARHSGAQVLIQVQDDGAGLDTAAIRALAVEKKLITPDAVRTERELWELIFAPGFTTAKTVTGISGRGVGLDVVKGAIQSLRGSIGIESARGKGTTITLILPLTLAIIEGFMTRIGADHYVFPLSLVEECVELAPEETNISHGRHLIPVRDHLVPYIRLREHFMINGEQPEFEQVVITNIDGRRIGVAVDMVLGGHQTVIKPLGRLYEEVTGIMGATILGDGTVAMILDVPQLVHMVESQEVRSAPGPVSMRVRANTFSGPGNQHRL
jgi:two-component system chemotaxis sensor kinase CheA